MESIWDIGIQIILIIQNPGDYLAGPMQFFTFLGFEEFYLFVAPVIFWCIDMRLGLSLGLRLMISGALNTILKLAFHQPRPYWIDKRVIAYGTESSFGIPSGHAQNAVVFWGSIAAWISQGWAWITAIIIAFFIGFSRLYLGVHFPTDVILGWAIGALLLWAFMRWEAPVLTWVRKYPPSKQIAITLIASLVLILAGTTIKWSLQNWQLPEEWRQTAHLADPNADPINPLNLAGIVSNAAVFFGLAAGGIIMASRGGFNAGGPILKRIIRFLLGIAGVFLIWYGLGAVFPHGEYLGAFILRYIRYGLVGFWVSGLAPMLFIRLHLADQNHD